MKVDGTDYNTQWDQVAWSDLSGVPATFSPSAHTHPAADITDFAEAVDDRVAALLVAGANITLTYNDGANTLTIASTGGGGGANLGAVLAINRKTHIF